MAEPKRHRRQSIRQGQRGKSIREQGRHAHGEAQAKKKTTAATPTPKMDRPK
jgi:hypothetical protein